ncbi:hypothetical protein ZIOFF_019718 [Zingiber officinale]|uniref:BZIP domain-containing protein n=2 Tax=Zingiber officinale TaxID=94328 RepID=A0A8J5HA13_ZINOF|nr:hypothetical protein ZIOFF_019718 [Zingiber officinale]
MANKAFLACFLLMFLVATTPSIVICEADDAGGDQVSANIVALNKCCEEEKALTGAKEKGLVDRGIGFRGTGMDDGEVDLSNHYLLTNPEMAQGFDEFLKNSRTCTHTHTCNPPGRAAAAHTHTCYHTHTQVFAAGEEEDIGEDEIKKSRKPLGNREAVRKYREKKKAHAAFLEEEVKKLQVLNQQLLSRLQGQAALEAEVVRLRSLLVDLRGKIDAELGGFPIQKQCNPPGLQCDSNGHCNVGNPEMTDWETSCVPSTKRITMNSMDALGSLVSSASQTG